MGQGFDGLVEIYDKLKRGEIREEDIDLSKFVDDFIEIIKFARYLKPGP